MTKPYYVRNSGKPWESKDVRSLRELAKDNTPTRVIGLKLGRTESGVRNEASKNNISLHPTNQHPYNHRAK